jgi:GNAT superfamily N-acetyltransferase
MTTSTRTRRSHAVRSVTADDVAQVARLLARAFSQDPVITWSIPDQARRRARGPHAFAAILGLYLPKGHVYADSRLRSAALWAPPGTRPIGAAEIAHLLPRLARVYGYRLPFVLAGLARVQRHRPDRPHWYLAYLGTDPDHQGEGLGAAVLTPVLDRCDREGLLAYLEASEPQLIPFYQRHGFAVVQQIRLPSGPPVWGMLRQPQPPARGALR